MSRLRMVNMVVFVLAIVAAIYYTTADKEAQGAVVMLLGVLYFVALPHLKQS